MRLPHGGRPAIGTPLFILAGPLMIVLSIWVSYVVVQRHRQLQLQIATDAAALATACGLADDECLTDRPERFDRVEKRARKCGDFIAGFNRIHNNPLVFIPNPDNRPDGELVIGTLQHCKDHEFDVTPGPLLQQPDKSDDERQFPGFRPCRNAVHVAVRRGGVAASSTAIVDRDVIGFKIQGAWTLPGQSVPAIPVAPVAIDFREWQRMICERGGADEHQLRLDGTPEKCDGGDGIPELTVKLGGNGLLCDVGHKPIDRRSEQPLARAVRQFRTGITVDDLSGPWKQRLMLHTPDRDEAGKHEGGRKEKKEDKEDREKKEQHAEGEKNGLRLGVLETPEEKLCDELTANLQGMVGQPRVWMVYWSASDNEVHVVGFVAARVMKAPQNKDRDLTIVLQPCQYITCTAETDSGRRDCGPRTLYNPYVGRVRLVE